jgi:predicted Rossmann-fold nucleotide-binding protein
VRAARQSAMEHRIDVTGIPPNEIRSEQIHGRLPSLDWRHV